MNELGINGWQFAWNVSHSLIVGVLTMWCWIDRRTVARRDAIETQIKSVNNAAQEQINAVRAEANERIAAVRDEAHAKLEDHEERLREKRERLTRVEEHLRTTPTHTDVAHVVELINAVKGELLRGLSEVQKDTLRETAQLGAQVQAVAGGMTGVGARLDLITQHLMKVNT